MQLHARRVLTIAADRQPKRGGKGEGRSESARKAGYHIHQPHIRAISGSLKISFMSQLVEVGNRVAPDAFARSVFAAEEVPAALDPDCPFFAIFGRLSSEPMQQNLSTHRGVGPCVSCHSR